MKFEPGNLYFNRIYIIQSLRPKDKRTGDDLLNDIILRRIKDGQSAEIKDIKNTDEMVAYLKHIRDNIKLMHLPFIHFETHGWEKGIQLTDRSCVSWEELVPYFLEINTACKNNLFISMAACKGGNIQFGVKVTEPCPFRGFIGPMEDVDDLDMLNSYQEFFETLLQNEDFEAAIAALNITAQGVKYHHMNAEAFFDTLVEYNNQLEETNPEVFKQRIDYVVQEELMRSQDILKKFGTVENFRKWAEDFARDKKPEMMQILKNKFCHNT